MLRTFDAQQTNGRSESDEQKNSLARAASAYLRSAMHQPVKWQEWGEEAFALAQSENKPILLDIGAVWCHWCHVMDRESYESAATAEIINEHFIAVKVDRDERPDIDLRIHFSDEPDFGEARSAVLDCSATFQRFGITPPRRDEIADAVRSAVMAAMETQRGAISMAAVT